MKKTLAISLLAIMFVGSLAFVSAQPQCFIAGDTIHMRTMWQRILSADLTPEQFEHIAQRFRAFLVPRTTCN